MMTNKYRTRMLRLLTVLIFLGHMTFWKVFWGWESGMASSMEWLCGSLYGVGNTALMWGVLFLVDGTFNKKRVAIKQKI